jgi:multidrug efflux pump subunit AcrA (membrane-fusion protein)
MNRRIAGVLLGTLLVAGGVAGVALSAELKTIKTQKTKDVVITLLNESGRLSAGKNSFVLEFTSPATRQPLDAGNVTLDAGMTMPGMAPMAAGATLTPDRTPGRYLGTITFPDRGTRQVTVTWDGPAGKGSTRFSVPVR